MTTEEFIIAVFCEIADGMPNLPKHSQAKLYPSELVTIGVLYALKGGYFRAFYRWLVRDYAGLFGGLPDRTRLQRALYAHRDWCDSFLAQPGFFTVIDSYGIELIHPIREGRSEGQIGKKGKSNWRWIVGMKLCWLINDDGQLVSWSWDTANVHDQVFLPLVAALEAESIVLADTGFNDADGIPANLKLCPRGTWNERMLVETALSLVTMVCHLKKVFHRSRTHFEARLAYVAAMFNALLALNRTLQPDADLQDRLYHDPAKDRGVDCPGEAKSISAEEIEATAATLLMSVELPEDWRDQIMQHMAKENPNYAQVKKQHSSLQGKLDRLKQ